MEENLSFAEFSQLWKKFCFLFLVFQIFIVFIAQGCMMPRFSAVSMKMHPSSPIVCFFKKKLFNISRIAYYFSLSVVLWDVFRSVGKRLLFVFSFSLKIIIRCFNDWMSVNWGRNQWKLKFWWKLLRYFFLFFKWVFLSKFSHNRFPYGKKTPVGTKKWP